MDSIDLGLAMRIVPELLDVLQARTRILQRVRLMQPIGRRTLATELGTTERVLRAEVEFLRQQGLLVSAPAGMWLSEEGQTLLEQLENVLAFIEGRSELSAHLSRALGIPLVLVVAGDCDDDEWVKDTLGYRAAAYMRAALTDDDVLAVTGGTTMAAVAKMMPAKGEAVPIQVVPARGGLGETISVQADTIAAEVAERLGGRSIMLHVPDRVSEDTLARLLSEPEVERRLAEVRRATLVIHGIGNAMKMAERRQMTADEVKMLTGHGAVAEAFGYYFDDEGDIVHSMSIVGLRLADLQQMRMVLAVAGGRSKANAIASAAKAYRMDVLVTDEGAAKALLQRRRDLALMDGQEQGGY